MQLHLILTILFQSTQPKRAATFKGVTTCSYCDISIHAAQEGCDPRQIFLMLSAANFNPRSPRGLRLSRFCGTPKSLLLVFQSTQPKRAATRSSMLADGRSKNFNPRSPRGLRLFPSLFVIFILYFNPRSPRGLRRMVLIIIHPLIKFQSTQPKRAATAWQKERKFLQAISIHAAQEGCDRHSVSPLLS